MSEEHGWLSSLPLILRACGTIADASPLAVRRVMNALKTGSLLS